MRAEPQFFPVKQGGDSGEAHSSIWDGNRQSHHASGLLEMEERNPIHSNL